MARLSDGVAAPNMREVRTNPVLRSRQPQRAITRAPKPYVAPIPVGPSYPAWNPTPTAQASPSYSNWAPAAQTNWGAGAATTLPSYFGGNAGGGFAGGGGGSSIASTPAAPPEPPKPKPISEADWLAGDTEYQNEIKGYEDTLKDFLARITTQETDFNNDYEVAKKGFGRNRERSMLSLGEDFTSRGLANSGMFADSRTKANAQFEDQETGMTTAKTRGLADFKNQRTDKERATGTQKGNARRASLARMAQKQAF